MFKTNRLETPTRKLRNWRMDCMVRRGICPVRISNDQPLIELQAELERWRRQCAARRTNKAA